jgi:hypothetical protein
VIWPVLDSGQLQLLSYIARDLAVKSVKLHLRPPIQTNYHSACFDVYAASRRGRTPLHANAVILRSTRHSLATPPLQTLPRCLRCLRVTGTMNSTARWTSKLTRRRQDNSPYVFVAGVIRTRHRV